MNSDLQKRNDDLEKRTCDLKKRTEKMTDELMKRTAELEKRDDDLQDQVTHLSRENHWLKATVADLTEQVTMLSDEASDVTHEASASTGKPDTYTQFISFACASDIVTLSCPNGRTIFVTSAYYGQYNDKTGSEVCP